MRTKAAHGVLNVALHALHLPPRVHAVLRAANAEPLATAVGGGWATAHLQRGIIDNDDAGLGNPQARATSLQLAVSDRAQAGRVAWAAAIRGFTHGQSRCRRNTPLRTRTC